MQNGRTSIGSFLRVAGALAPLVIHEVVKDRETAWRWVRITSAVTAVLSGMAWRDRVRSERQDRSYRDFQRA
jgi:hypothetical protein